MKITTAIDRYIHKANGKSILDISQISLFMKLHINELNFKSSQDVKKFFEKGDFSKIEEFVKLDEMKYRQQEIENDFL